MTRNIFQYENYSAILIDEYKRRHQKNPQYSQRAFAKDLELSPSRLSEVLNGRVGLSAKSAEVVANKLSMDEIEREFFVCLINMKFSRNNRLRHSSKVRLSQLKDFTRGKELTLEQVEVISSWHAFAMLELCRPNGVKYDIAEIAKKMNVTTFDAEYLIDQLVKFKYLLNEKGILKTNHHRTEYRGKVPSATIRRFHRSLLEKAMQSIEEQDVKQRTLSSNVIAIDKNDLSRAQEMIRDFQVKFSEEFGDPSENQEIYCMSMQLFKLI